MLRATERSRQHCTTSPTTAHRSPQLPTHGRSRPRLMYHHRPQHRDIPCSSRSGPELGTRSPCRPRSVIHHPRHQHGRRFDRGPHHPRTAQWSRSTPPLGPAAKTPPSPSDTSTTRYPLSRASMYSNVTWSSSSSSRSSSSLRSTAGAPVPRSVSTHNSVSAIVSSQHSSRSSPRVGHDISLQPVHGLRERLTIEGSESPLVRYALFWGERVGEGHQRA